MNYTGSFALNQQNLLGKGLKAMNTLLANVKTLVYTKNVMSIIRLLRRQCHKLRV